MHRVFFVFATLALSNCFGSLVTAEETEPSAESSHRDFALTHAGDAGAGKVLFHDAKKTQCANCHRITGMEKSGPNLDGIGEKYTRAELIEHVLRPSLTIMPGYEQATVLLKDGRTVIGRFERATKLEVRMIDAAGKQTNLKRRDMQEVQFATTSMMPDNLASTVSKEEFTDLIEYLVGLRFGIKNGLGAGGQLVPIPHLATPIRFECIHPAEVEFKNPVWCGPLPGRAGELIVLEHQEAKAWRFLRSANPPRKELFLDLAKDAYISANQGLMCFAFHPDYQRNGRYFVEHEVHEDGKVKTLVVERLATPDRLRDSGQPAIRLLEVEQPAFNHNGGCIAFGPDGMLYAAFGDGGPQKDPEGYSQNPADLKGSFVRIDVDRRESGSGYSVPSDNPFLAARERDPTIRPETWAIGFREPWRFSFDRLTGDLWVGDVGQNRFEEVAIVKRGENHGWNVREGFAPFSDQYQRDGANYVDPLFAYEHGLGFSVTGGEVYRANPKSTFYGVYIFGDFNTRRVWGLRQRQGKLMDVRELGMAPGGIASFGVDHVGEILLVTYGGGVFQLDLSGASYE